MTLGAGRPLPLATAGPGTPGTADSIPNSGLSGRTLVCPPILVAVLITGHELSPLGARCWPTSQPPPSSGRPVSCSGETSRLQPRESPLRSEGLGADPCCHLHRTATLCVPVPVYLNGRRAPSHFHIWFQCQLHTGFIATQTWRQEKGPRHLGKG